MSLYIFKDHLVRFGGFFISVFYCFSQLFSAFWYAISLMFCYPPWSPPFISLTHTLTALARSAKDFLTFSTYY